jgi:hypothetical protein
VRVSTWRARRRHRATRSRRARQDTVREAVPQGTAQQVCASGRGSRGGATGHRAAGLRIKTWCTRRCHRAHGIAGQPACRTAAAPPSNNIPLAAPCPGRAQHGGRAAAPGQAGGSGGARGCRSRGRERRHHVCCVRSAAGQRPESLRQTSRRCCNHGPAGDACSLPQ